MTASSPQTCPSCGAAASGNFCAACGAPLTAQQCAACHTTLSPGAHFCHKCGAAAPGTVRGPVASGAVGRSATPSPDYHGMRPLPARDRTAWVVAGSMILVTIAAVAYFATRRGEPTVPSMANAGNAVPGAADAGNGGTPAVRAPDISNMTPREQYARLVARIARAEAAGDSATIINFTPMALGAYSNLPPGDRDIDARFHAALLQLHAGLVDNARALSDSIMKESPDNLLGYYVRAQLAARSGDAGQARAARAAFGAHYDAEMKRDRPEYQANRPLLEQYRKGDGAR